MSCDKYSVLYTHQKTKKAKTWQDGFLRVTGSKAVLCDEVSKTLDSLFVRKDQVVLGEELESERYLITIEEKLNPSSDRTHEVALKTQESEVERSEGPLYQPGKRKRRYFQPPAFNQKRPMLTGFTDAKDKKPSEETNPRHGRLVTANKPPSRTEFFNVYSSHSSKQEPNSLQVTHRKEPRDERLAILQTKNRSYPVGKQWEDRQDQRVPSNMTGNCSAAGKENEVFSREGLSGSKCPLQKERLRDTESKRSTSQILALFSSRKNTQLPTMALEGQTIELKEANLGIVKETQSRNLNETADKFSSQVDSAKVIAHTRNASEIGTAFQPIISDNDSLGQVQETGEELGDSLNLSPDSFAACSNDTFGSNFRGGDAMCEDATQESAVTRSPDSNQRQSKVWSQNDSESVSPLIRLLTSVEKADSQGCIGVKDDGAQRCNVVKENRQLVHCSFGSPDSAAVGFSSSLSDPPLFPNVTSTQQSSYGVQEAAQEEAIRSEFAQVGSFSEASCNRDIISPLITAKGSDFTSYGNRSLFQPKLDPFSTNTKGFSRHPGSLFPYSKLQTQDQNNHLSNSSNAALFSKGFSGFDELDLSFEHQAIDDGEGHFQQYEISPEFYASETEKTSEWRVTPNVATKVIPTDSRTVTAGDGHSWKGSVVSDTVKRGCSSISVVSVQRQGAHSQPSNGDQRAPSSSLSWIDSISSSEAHYDSPCLLSTQGFATSESIALSSTEGFVRNNQATEGNPTDIKPEFVQRVPQLPKRRAPLLTAPPEDLSMQQTVSRNPVVYHGLPIACSSTEFLKFSSKPKAMVHVITGEGEIGPLQGETSQLHKANVGNLCKERRDTGQSALRSSCRRVGLRRVGIGCSRDLPNSENALSQSGLQFRQKSNGYRPPAAPEFVSNNSSGDRSMAGELSFPSAEECDGSVTPTRHVTVPVTFLDVMQYRQVFKSALREHLNIVLFELARTYHSALQKVDVSGFSADGQGIRQSSDGPCCPHGQARLRAVKKDGANKGRLFYTCPGMGQAQCKFFKWADEYQTNKTGSKEAEHKSSNKLTLFSSASLMSFFRSHNIAFYCECHLVRKNSDAGRGKFGAAKAKKWGKQRGFDTETAKKGLYLELSRKDHSSTYSKDDIWIISKTLSFNRDSTFLASSAYYGPSSTGELEIHPISGYSPSNWQSGETVHALMACNAGTELTCISNIEHHVKMQNIPVLPYILRSGGQTEQSNTRSALRASSYVPPTLRTSGGQLDLPLEVTESLAEEMIARFSLNKDQAVALLSCASMFSSSAANSSSSLPVCLIHGVFGAGKSFLLAVVLLYLVELFKASDALNHQSSNTSSLWKILVSSTTNVAVDRILLGLLEFGFEDFVRVGSIRKIAKPVLPYSVHSTGSDSQELKELQSLLKTELTPSERNHVRKGIEQHKLGENKRKLSQVRVVGVTCAACVFPCLDKLKFPVLLLDECSQMTEPASLLPMARFECRKLVLVGDPKQLSPTIQGSEPDHDAGLEQTLFDRLMKMGYEPTMLRTQYRCHPAISGISNSLFYENKLLDGVTAEDRTPVVDLVPTLCFYNVGKGKEKCGRDGSYYNEEEAKFVVFLIECLLESGVEPAQIGVITLYKSQLQTISNNLTASRATSHAELKAIQISTVDAFQGGEKDLIILSCVRTDHIGFIDCDR